MSRVEWSESLQPDVMLRLLGPQASERKLRLFACHCCRRVWPQLTDERSRRAVELAEQEADGLIPRAELYRAFDLAGAVQREARGLAAAPGRQAAADVSKVTTSVWIERNADEAAACAARISATGSVPESAFQAQLLRDLFGPSPSRPVGLHPSRRTPAVVAVARGIYEEKRFEELPVLADALEEAGCADAAILGHCRGPGPHVRGCWVVDLVLGKE